MADTASRIQKRRRRSQWPLGIAVGAMWICWDTAAKFLLEDRLVHAAGNRQAIAPGLELHLHYHTPPWPLASLLGSAAAALMLAALLFTIRRSWAAVAVGVGMGGFLGDLVDQVPDGRLTQFIVFQPRGLALPPFNFSEVGIGTLVLYAAWTGFWRLRDERSGRS